MPRAGASESLEQPAPKPRASEAGKAVKKAPGKLEATGDDKPAGATAATEPEPAAKAKKSATATKATAPKAAAKAPVGDVVKAGPADPGDDRAGAFPAKTLDRLRRALEEERETYWRQALDLAAEAEALASEREPGDTQFDEESGEGDTLNVERERDLALSASARQAVEEIDRALRRMDAGTYGTCERCSKKISVARLEALAFAALCIECKSRGERRR
jgi:RNA polymerase-binding transcription factor DksA